MDRRSVFAFSAKRRIGLAALCAAVVCMLLAGCVNQHPERAASGDGAPRLVATSVAAVSIAERLDLDLVGVPRTAAVLPERYADATVVGPPMAPDLEIVAKLHPDFVVSPVSLENDLRPKYASIGKPSIFLDLNSVDGLYRSISYLGRKFDREQEAQRLVDDYERFMEGYRASIEGRRPPRVLILMGLPGSYLVATPHSYAGSLAELAGAENVYADAEDAFVNANTEDMLARDPDIILRTSHALPDDVMKMFAEEFSTNDVWKHFRAVREGRVFDLSHKCFGMSATFAYPDALRDLRSILYEGSDGSDGTSACVFGSGEAGA
ncbi:heme ABC transporter substrate-binding protein IsdE [Gordonibacter sp. Marseille-P4307]|uniref:heme ABC transporter substrate-binding protein IsdE n=1 Tax=Gordonibacter sp. Marseille-P4307 TaxID=2161815 RepID=UPI000F52B40B|nr:heme ABC transporter substrate-binding protein IsdE [Gordonibacter sp. Marseille-P4307]